MIKIIKPCTFYTGLYFNYFKKQVVVLRLLRTFEYRQYLALTYNNDTDTGQILPIFFFILNKCICISNQKMSLPHEFNKILQQYTDLIQLELPKLEKEIQEKIAVFEKEYGCVVFPIMPTVEDVRFKQIHINLDYHYVPCNSYNLMVRRLDLDTQYYPIQQVF